MRYFVFILGLLILPGFFIACQDAADAPVAITRAAPTPPAKDDGRGHTADDDAPRISLADAKKDFDAGTAVFIDTRAEDIYKQGHVKGAINITLQDDASKYKGIPKGRKIIVYCS
jgi:3-mercaptopyruvate sulfurtransferase SseA